MRRVATKAARGVARARFIIRTKATTSVPTRRTTSERRLPSRYGNDYGEPP